MEIYELDRSISKITFIDNGIVFTPTEGEAYSDFYIKLGGFFSDIVKEGLNIKVVPEGAMVAYTTLIRPNAVVWAQDRWIPKELQQLIWLLEQRYKHWPNTDK